MKEPGVGRHGEATGLQGFASEGEGAERRAELARLCEALRAEERFRLASSVTSDLIYEWDVKGDQLVWFGDIDGVLGFAPGEIPRTVAGWVARIHPEDAARLSEAVEHHRVATEPIRYEYRIQHKDGRWRHWLDRGAPILDEQGRPCRWVGTCTDITERRVAEELLRAQRDLAVRIGEVDGLPETLGLCLEAAIAISRMDCGGIYLLDPGTGALELACSIGLSEGFVREATHYPAGAPQVEAARAGRPIYMDLTREPFGSLLTPTQRAEGIQSLGVLPVTNQGRPIACLNLASRSTAEIPVSVRHAVETITSQIGSAIVRARARKELAESEAKFRALAEHTMDALIRFDRDHRHLYVNPIVEVQSGIPAGDILGRTLGELGHPAALVARWDEAIDKVFASGEPHRMEVELSRSGAWLDTLLIPERSADGAVVAVLASSRDITERKRATAAQERLQEQLRQSQKMEAIGRLAGGVAHDFNNILTGINGYAEMVLEGLRAEDPLRDDVLELRRAGERASELVVQLLAFSRNQVIRPQVIQANDILAGSQRMIQRIIGEDIWLEFLPDRQLWPVRADPNQLDQILINLAVNARDAMPNGGRLTIGTANVALEDGSALVDGVASAGDFVQLAVSDTGGGIAEEHLPHIFEPFFSTKAKVGTGLGLATVYGIVTQNGGFIRVSTEVGQGTTFRIFLPRAREALDAPRKVAEIGYARGAETILIAEDDEVVRQLSERLLARLGYAVLSADSGEAALRLSAGHAGEIHLLLTDVVMPGMNGRELHSALLARRPALRALYISGYTADVIVQRGVLEEGTHFLPKPFGLQALASKVREVLDGDL